jgi:hypothetical protein
LVWAVPDNGAIRRAVKHLAIEHPPVFERQMQPVALFRFRLVVECDDAGVTTRADLDPIR